MHKRLPALRSMVAATLLAQTLVAAAADDPRTQGDDEQITIADTTYGRWAVELKAGLIEPSLEEYDRFYGDEDTGHLGVAFGYRFLPWFELDAETQYLKDNGVGQLPSTGGPGAPVEYTLVPVHVFAKFRLERDTNALFVPYVGIGIARAAYRQKIELQGEREGKTDTGPSVRAGVEISMNRLDPTGKTDPLKRTYLFIEAQQFEAKVDGIDLGGDALLIGFRFELGGP